MCRNYEMEERKREGLTRLTEERKTFLTTSCQSPSGLKICQAASLRHCAGLASAHKMYPRGHARPSAGVRTHQQDESVGASEGEHSRAVADLSERGKMQGQGRGTGEGRQLGCVMDAV